MMIFVLNENNICLAAFRWVPRYPVNPQVEMKDIVENFIEPSTFTLIFQPILYRFWSDIVY